jgi:hypothetical protein
MIILEYQPNSLVRPNAAQAKTGPIKHFGHQQMESLHLRENALDFFLVMTTSGRVCRFALVGKICSSTRNFPLFIVVY